MHIMERKKKCMYLFPTPLMPVNLLLSLKKPRFQKLSNTTLLTFYYKPVKRNNYKR